MTAPSKNYENTVAALKKYDIDPKLVSVNGITNEGVFVHVLNGGLPTYDEHHKPKGKLVPYRNKTMKKAILDAWEKDNGGKK